MDLRLLPSLCRVDLDRPLDPVLLPDLRSTSLRASELDLLMLGDRSRRLSLLALEVSFVTAGRLCERSRRLVFGIAVPCVPSVRIGSIGSP